MHKSEGFAAFAKENGWTAEVNTVVPPTRNFREIKWHVNCVRGQETLHIVYTGNMLTEGTYTYGDHIQKPARKAAVEALITGDPTLRRTKLRLTESQAKEGRIPFNPEDDSDYDIMLELSKRTVVWMPKLDTEARTDKIPAAVGDKGFRVYTAKSGRRIVEWVDPHGFHAIALEQILDVA